MSKFVSIRNIRFMIKEVFDSKALTEYDYYSKHNEKMFDMVIDAALKLANKLMYPVLEEMDKNQPVLEAGQVKVHGAVKKNHEGVWAGRMDFIRVFRSPWRRTDPSYYKRNCQFYFCSIQLFCQCLSWTYKRGG